MDVVKLLLVVALGAITGCGKGRGAPPAGPPGADKLTVTTEGGALIGRWRDGVREFLGIPYAAPPVGELRWRPPAPAAPWAAPRDATRRGDACVQLDEELRAPESEDCLNLNVWAPAGARAPLPVLVWIHGGAFYQGSGSDELYDGARLAARAGAIVVTFNYRVGPLGFLAHSELAREQGRASAPSYGILDQQAALEWVRRNIGAFGGDRERITLFGASAGAWSVCVHLAAPASRGRFARAIMQSGACSDALYFDPAAAAAQGDALAAAVGCVGPAPLPCLRQKSAAELVRALPMKRGLILRPGVWWGPVVDGATLPRRPLEAIRAGDFARVPLLIGANRDEGVLHTMSFQELGAADIDDFTSEAFGAGASRAIADRYRRATSKQALDDIITDGIFVCHARRVARAVTEHGVPAFLYHFTRPLAEPRAHALGATHSIDLFFLWGNRANGIGLTAQEWELSRLMMDAWGAFARTGDPSTAALRWPRYSIARDEHAILDLPPAVGAHLKRELCDFWDGLDRKQ